MKTPFSARCPTGSFSADGLLPCTACPKHYYQPAQGQTTCIECGSFQVTLQSNSTSLTDCVDGGMSLLQENLNKKQQAIGCI